MNCSACRHENPSDSLFCEHCGTALEQRCPSCGSPSGPAARFCRKCGTVLTAERAEKAAEPEARKVVTIVFADLIGSTSLHERLDPESVSRVMDRYHRAVRAPVEAHGGTVVQLLGDGVMCAFGVPRVAEDDAIRAVRAAVGIQEAFRAFAREERALVGTVGLRVAVNTGEVVVSDDYAAGIGDPLNVAARLQQEAHDGDVLIGEATQRLVRELVTLAPVGKIALKGRAETVAAFRVVTLEPPVRASATPFVGREDELRRIMAVHEAAVASRRARLAVILGSPGLGKSRLMDEVARRIGDAATVLTAQCDAAGGATFAPIARAVRTHLGIGDAVAGDALRAAIEAAAPGDEAERGRIASGIAALVGGAPASPEETFFVVRRLLGALAAVRPVVLAIDDLQWAEPLLLDLTEHLIQWTADAPLLVLVAARPELRETRSSLAAPGGLVTDVVTLAGLDASAATRLAANVIGSELPAAVAGRVLATSEGNPLFVGELVRMLVHDGTLKREGDRWTIGAELARLEMPPTIQALLAARIERLRPEDRTVLERAAVVGRQFSRAAVTHLLPREITDLDARLEALRRSELIEPDTGWFLGEPALRFHHVLIRDAAYRRVLKNTRAELHARFADWLESRVGDAVEHDETIGWHLEQAHQHLRELGPLDASGRALGERAAKYLAVAGRRALARDDLSLAGSLLGRALDRVDAQHPDRADLILDWCEALLAAGDVDPAARAIDELGRLVDGSERLRAWHACFAGQLAALTDPQALRATADAVAAAAETLTSAGDAAGEAKAHSVHALALGRLGRVGACEAALDRALAAARRAGDRRRSNGVLAGAPLAALWGPSPVTRASGRCLDVVRVLRITQGAPAVEAVALRCQGVLEALRGRSEAARRMIASSRRMVEELGITHRLLEADMFGGLIELLEGDAVAAERCLRPAYEGLRQNGLRIDAARAAALLGRALLAQGRAAEAEALSHDSESLAGDDLEAAIAWRGVRAEALARRGEQASAVEFARAAVDLAAATDSLLYHADARVALAAALRAAGRTAEAAAEEARAIELWEAKGATVLAARARQAGVSAASEARTTDRRDEPTRRRPRVVRATAATALAPRVSAAINARDVEAFPGLLAEGFTVLDHVNGVTYDRDGMLFTWRAMARGEELSFRREPLATLGDALVLSHESVSGSGVGGRLGVGPYETERITLLEVDGEGRGARGESFAANKLGDAIVQLYTRYAERLPDGPERVRAAATARSVSLLLLTLRTDVALYTPAYDPQVEMVDHRASGFPTLRGVDRVLERVRSLFELATDVVVRIDEVLDVRPNALCVRWVESGVLRATGGAYERQFLLVNHFGPNGLATRSELFPVDREDAAIARCEELANEAAAPVVRRRVRPNAATRHMSRLEVAITARDADALPSLFAMDRFEVAEHTTGVTYGAPGLLATLSSVLRARSLVYRQEPLATLGESFALYRVSAAASGFAGGTFDVGSYERELLCIHEVDESGRGAGNEVFDSDRLGEAVARFYAYYAEREPDGPSRARAAAAAQTVAALLGRPEDWLLAPDVVAEDHRSVGFGVLRGADVKRAMRALFDLMEEYTTRVDEVLALRSDALLVRYTHTGTDRDGGAFERILCELWIFGADGQVSRWEQFDGDRDAEALARFDKLTAALDDRRRLPSNRATMHAARVDAALAAGDLDALDSLLAERTTVVDHTTGASYGREGVLTSWRSLLRGRDPRNWHEPLATLGDSLTLCRVWVTASGLTGARVDVGAYEKESIHLIEVDAEKRRAHTEIFAANRLGDAIAALYARWAEALPEGLARTRAAATARSVAAWVGPFDPDRVGPTYHPTIVCVDHRTLGTISAEGAVSLHAQLRPWLELADGVTLRDDAILALRPDALLVRRTFAGTDRATGGVFELQSIVLRTFGDDGRLARYELFDADRDADALARFDELAAGPTRMDVAHPPARTARRVRPNRARASVDRLNAALAAGDAEAVAVVLADECDVVDYILGTDLERREVLAAIQFQLGATAPTFVEEALATLGDSLVLTRWSHAASGLVTSTVDMGPYQSESVCVVEVDAQGRRRRVALFPVTRLGDAVACLYQRHAELLPAGPAQTRAAATARAVAAFSTPFDLERLAAAVAPTVEVVDHRLLGTWTSSGAEALRRNVRSLVEMSEGITYRVHNVLDLRSGAILEKAANSGTSAVGGGAFERPLLILRLFGADGRQTRIEYFDVDQEAEAFARFDELTAAPSKRRIVANAATAAAARMEAAANARDAETFAAIVGENVECLDHTTGTTFDRAGYLTTFRMGGKAEGFSFHHELLASLGDSLALYRSSLSARGFTGWHFDVGPYERQRIVVMETDPQGRVRWQELFEGGRLGDGIACLYARYADRAPEGPERARAAAIARTVVAIGGPLEGYGGGTSTFAPDLEFVDHRRVGLGPMHGADSFLRGIRTLLDLADDVTNRIDDVLALRPDAYLAHWTNVGRDRATGGEYERPFLLLWVFGPDGRVTRGQQFDLDREDQALAGFDELIGEATLGPDPLRIPPNTATRASERFGAAIAADDRGALEAVCVPDLVFEDRRHLMLDGGGRDLLIAGSRYIRRARTRSRRTWLATAGDRLALDYTYWWQPEGVSPFELETITLTEVDADGRIIAVIVFDGDARRAASLEMFERYARSEAARGARADLLEFLRAAANHDLERVRAVLPREFFFDDHRRTGLGRLEGAAEYVASLAALYEQSPDAVIESLYRVATSDRGVLAVSRTFGTLVAGGPFESVFLSLALFEGDRFVGVELFELEDLDAARARLDAHAAESAA